MADKNLSDDMVKLVEYTIVTIERGEENILSGDRPKLKLVKRNMTGEAFASWIISEDLKMENGGNEQNEYLRVYYNVLHRWPKQDLEFEEKQLDYLEGIRDALQA